MMLRIPAFIDRSSLVRQRNRKAGYAVTATEQVIRVRPLPVGTSTKRSKIALNVWTDAKYAFGVAHTYGTIWKEQGVLTRGKQIEHGVYLPKSVAVIHCDGHQKGDTVQETGNMIGIRWQNRQLKEKR